MEEMNVSTVPDKFYIHNIKFKIEGENSKWLESFNECSRLWEIYDETGFEEDFNNFINCRQCLELGIWEQ